MPRRNAASLAILPSVYGRPSQLRPRADAPATIRSIVSDLVQSVPPEHFQRGDADLVEQLAQAIELARKAYVELETHGPVIDGKVSPWNVVLEKAHRSSVALAARLRLCPQSRTDPKSVTRRLQAYRPPSAYEVDDDA